MAKILIKKITNCSKCPHFLWIGLTDGEYDPGGSRFKYPFCTNEEANKSGQRKISFLKKPERVGNRYFYHPNGFPCWCPLPNWLIDKKDRISQKKMT